MIGHPDMQARIETRLKAFFDRAPLLLDLLDHLKAASPRGDLGINRHNIGEALLRRAHGTLQAIVITATNGYGSDAMFLCRSQFEACVTAKYLAAHPDEIDDFGDYGSVRRRRYLERLEQQFPGSVPAALLAKHQTPEMDARLAQFSGKTGKLKSSWNGKSAEQLAADPAVDELGRYLWLYGPMSDVGHGRGNRSMDVL